MNALGYSIGTSICESDKVELAKDIMAKAKEKGVNFLIPQDNVVATEYKADAEFKPVDSDNIPDGWMGLDIGEKTALATAIVPLAKLGHSETPIGPFHTTVPAFLIASAKSLAVFSPISRPIQPSGMLSESTGLNSASALFP